MLITMLTCVLAVRRWDVLRPRATHRLQPDGESHAWQMPDAIARLP